LITANTGAPFSKAGVPSFRFPHTSPKSGENPQMVGNKGLGFRAVLIRHNVTAAYDLPDLTKRSVSWHFCQVENKDAMADACGLAGFCHLECDEAAAVQGVWLERSWERRGFQDQIDGQLFAMLVIDDQ
jgi:hypothetical protein